MKLAVLLVENRFDTFLIQQNHYKFLPKDHVFYTCTKVNSISEYNKFLTDADTWKKIKEENILIIQHDSALLRTGIEEFYKWDYVGAPIKHIDFPAMNGGLSFRKKSAMIKVIENIPYNGTDNEDMYFCNGLKQLGMILPPIEVAKNFSCETIFGLGSLGFHAIESWLTPDQCEQIKNQYK